MKVEQVIADIRKLELKKGDVLVLGDKAARYFSMLPPQAMNSFVEQIGFDIPFIVGDASKLTRDDLVKLLENMIS